MFFVLICYLMLSCFALSCPKNFSAQSDLVLFCAPDNKILKAASVATCVRITLVFTGVQNPTSTQLIDPGPAGILLVVEQNLRWVQPIRCVQLTALQQDESGPFGPPWGKNKATMDSFVWR